MERVLIVIPPFILLIAGATTVSLKTLQPAARIPSATHSLPLPPGPRGTWLLGSLRDFRAGMLSFFDRCRAEHGPISYFRLGPRRVLLVSEPAAIEEVLVTKNRSFQKHYAIRLLQPVIGNGLLLSEGKFWLTQRRLVQPAFSHRAVEGFVDVVGRQVERLATQWERDSQRDIYRDMTDLTVRIAAEGLLGCELAADHAALSEALEIVHADFEHRFMSAFNPPLWIPTAANRKLRGAIRTLNGIIERLIADRRSRPAGRIDALSLLLRAEEGENSMTDRQLRDEVMTLLLAGHDTTANALTWACVLLARHPEVMQKLRTESLAVLGTRTPAASDLPRLTFSRQVVQEAMRLYPPAYVFGREAICETVVAGYRVPKGTRALICQWLMHRDSRFFSEPAEFRPERWTDEFQRALPTHAYLPFGGGPRVCLGKEFAMAEAVCILSMLAARFDLSLLSNPQPWPTVTLRPSGAVTTRVELVRGST